MGKATWLVDGNTVYILNKKGENFLSFNIQPGKAGNGLRVPDNDIKSIASRIVNTLNENNFLEIL